MCADALEEQAEAELGVGRRKPWLRALQAVLPKRDNKRVPICEAVQYDHEFYRYYVNLLFLHTSPVCLRDQVTAHR